MNRLVIKTVTFSGIKYSKSVRAFTEQGVAVRLQPGLAAVPGNPGEFSWNGANGTGFFADPKEQLVVAFGTAAPGDLRKYYREQVQDLVYGALNR